MKKIINEDDMVKLERKIPCGIQQLKGNKEIYGVKQKMALLGSSQLAHRRP